MKLNFCLCKNSVFEYFPKQDVGKDCEELGLVENKLQIDLCVLAVAENKTNKQTEKTEQKAGCSL